MNGDKENCENSQNDKGKETFSDSKEICTYLKQPFSETNFKTELKDLGVECDSLKVPFPKIRLIPPNLNKLSKTPQKKLMSPDPEIK